MRDARRPVIRPGREGMLAAVGGAVAALGQAPFGWWFAAVAGLSTVIAVAARSESPWRAGASGWWAGAGYFLVSLHWLVEPFLVDIARHGWMAPFALLGMSGGLALFWAGGSALAHFAVASADDAPNPVLRAVLPPMVWAAGMTAAEYARGHVLTGFPWALPGYAWIDTPVDALAASTGPYGLVGFTFLAAAVLGLGGRLVRVAGAAAAVALAAYMLLPQRPGMAPAGPMVRLVQPDIAQRDKWDPALIPVHFDRQLEATRALPRPDLVIWPETAIPWPLDRAGDALAMIADAAGGPPVAIGVQRSEGIRAFNSLAVIGEGGRVDAVYDKHHLVPFGEYVPAGWLTRGLGLRSMAARDGYGFSAGTGPAILDLPGGLGRVLPLICYEAIFPSHVATDAGSAARPAWILQVTNDAWFGTFAGPQQHLVQARFRAIEQGLPLVRVANTGISAVIDAQGRILISMPLGRGGHLDSRLPEPAPPTLYARTGDLPAMAFVLIVLAFACARRAGQFR